LPGSTAMYAPFVLLVETIFFRVLNLSAIARSGVIPE
jgi:hypothetical protein